LAAYRKCKAQTGRFLTALQDLNSRLDIGLTLQSYGDRLGDVKVAHDAVPAGELQYRCLKKVAVPAEGAPNVYLVVYREWDDCVTNYVDTCNVDRDLDTQSLWTAAAKSIRKAQAGLAQLRH